MAASTLIHLVLRGETKTGEDVAERELKIAFFLRLRHRLKLTSYEFFSSSNFHLEVAKETSILLCTCRLAYLLCLQPKEIGKGKTNKSWLYQDLSMQPKCSNLVFGLCGKISGRLRNLSGSPRDVVHVEEGIDDEEQVPLMREDKREL